MWQFQDKVKWFDIIVHWTVFYNKRTSMTCYCTQCITIKTGTLSCCDNRLFCNCIITYHKCFKTAVCFVMSLEQAHSVGVIFLQVVSALLIFLQLKRNKFIRHFLCNIFTAIWMDASLPINIALSGAKNGHVLYEWSLGAKLWH